MVGYSKGTVDADAYGQVAKLPVNGGHPNGFYMARSSSINSDCRRLSAILWSW